MPFCFFRRRGDRFAGPPAVASTALAVLCSSLTACAFAELAAPPATAPAERVVLISVDGLRADGVAHMPVLSSLASRGAWSDSVYTVVPALTLPGHLSMLSGRDVTTVGITSNVIDETTALRLVTNGVSTVFGWTDAIGGWTAGIAGASLIPRASQEDAATLLQVDSLVVTALDASAVADAAVGLAGANQPPVLLFAHFADADLAGHEHGWVDSAGGLTAEYLSAVARIDAAIGRIWSAIEADVAAGTVALLVTSDHGGGAGDGCTAGIDATKEHCSAADADRRVPVVLIGAGITPRRLGRARITQVAPTVAALLGVYVPLAADDPLEY